MLRSLASGLEAGRWDGRTSRVLASAWGAVAARRLVRPAVVPAGIDVVCVGGATLGGSGKTRVAIACARELSSAGARVVLVGHAYRAAPGRARVVLPTDALEDVGDEAIVCVRALAPAGAHVVVAAERQCAIDCAARLSPDVIVLDGPLRITRPGGRELSLLALDAVRPWGSGRPPPAGDLRAPREALLACADRVVDVDPTPTHVRWMAGPPLAIASLRNASVGLFTAIARPDRLVTALGGVGVELAEIVSVPDHGPLGREARARILYGRGRPGARAQSWLATEKCALHLERLPLGLPLGILDAAAESVTGLGEWAKRPHVTP
jgi:tetraacyldisaccharide 4'-kinase